VTNISTYVDLSSHKFFEWDENISNKKKHGVSFEEAKTIFRDESYGGEFTVKTVDSLSL
jgi:hypothetical protein